MFGAAVVFLFLGSVGAFGLLLVLALMPQKREAPAATFVLPDRINISTSPLLPAWAIFDSLLTYRMKFHW